MCQSPWFTSGSDGFLDNVFSKRVEIVLLAQSHLVDLNDSQIELHLLRSFSVCVN